MAKMLCDHYKKELAGNKMVQITETVFGKSILLSSKFLVERHWQL